MEQVRKIDLTDVNILVAGAVGNVVNDFIGDREIRGNRPGTITFYKNELKIFTRWLSAAGARELADITPDLLRNYFLNLRQNRKTNGIHKNFTVIRTLLLWAWIEYDQNSICPITKIKVSSPDEKEQKVVSLEDFSILLNACKGKNQYRDRAILYFLLDTGIRRQELCRLQIQTLGKNGVVQLESEDTKTGDRRKVFLTRETQKALKTYLARRGNLDFSSPLFATEKGEPLTTSGMRQIIRRLCSQAGIHEKGMHEFRRGFALESFRNGADLISIQKMLGQKRVETTTRYLPLDEDDLKQIHDKTSPVNRVKNRR